MNKKWGASIQETIRKNKFQKFKNKTGNNTKAHKFRDNTLREQNRENLKIKWKLKND